MEVAAINASGAVQQMGALDAPILQIADMKSDALNARHVQQDELGSLAIFAKGLPVPATMNISLTEPLKRFVDEQVREGGFSSTSDYMRDLIRRQQRFAAEGKLRSLIAEGLASGPAEPLTPEFFAGLRKQARARRK